MCSKILPVTIKNVYIRKNVRITLIMGNWNWWFKRRKQPKKTIKETINKDLETNDFNRNIL